MYSNVMPYWVTWQRAFQSLYSYHDVHWCSCISMQVVKMLSEKGETERRRLTRSQKTIWTPKMLTRSIDLISAMFVLFDRYKVIECSLQTCNILQHLTTCCNVYVEMDTQDTHANLQADSFDISLLWSHFVGPTGVWQSVSWSSRTTLAANTSECFRVPHLIEIPSSPLELLCVTSTKWPLTLSWICSISCNVDSFCSVCRREVLALSSLSTKLLLCSLRYVVCCIQWPVGWNF